MNLICKMLKTHNMRYKYSSNDPMAIPGKSLLIKSLCLVSCLGKYVAQGLDSSGLITSTLDVCISVIKHAVNNNVSVNFNQECVRILLAIASLLLYL